MGKFNNNTKKQQEKTSRGRGGKGKPGFKQALLLIPAELHRKRKAEAVLHGIPFNKYLIKLLERA